MRRIITLVTDKDSFFEIGSSWGTTMIVGLARLDGFSCGILASDPRVNGGVLTAHAAGWETILKEKERR